MLPCQGGDNDEMTTLPSLPRLLDSEELSTNAEAGSFWKSVPAILGGQRRACFGGIRTLSRLRPFARRRLMTARPPAALIRTRKPWVRFRLVLLG